MSATYVKAGTATVLYNCCTLPGESPPAVLEILHSCCDHQVVLAITLGICIYHQSLGLK